MTALQHMIADCIGRSTLNTPSRNVLKELRYLLGLLNEEPHCALDNKAAAGLTRFLTRQITELEVAMQQDGST